MIKKKYLKQIFAFCFLRIIACRSFLTEVFSLSQNYGYNDREEILDTDICYLRPAYHCLQKVSFSAKTSDTIEKQKNSKNIFASYVLLLAGPFIQTFSLSAKNQDIMKKKKYLKQIFAICFMRIIAYRSFLSLSRLRIQ